MTNELILLFYIIFVSLSALGALYLGKETLIGLVCVQAVLVNLFVTKEISLFGLSATASDALAVGIALCLNLLQEYFGRPITQKAIWGSFFCALFYTGVAFLHVLYTPVPGNIASTYFDALLSPMPRIIVASLITYIIVQQTEYKIYGYLKTRLQNQYFILRNYSSIAVTQLLDTVLFSFLGLYGLTQNYSKLSTIRDIILISYSIKLLVLLIAAPFLAFSKKIIFA